ncbi:hypothetical protein MN608_07872 [Microdochium nivale]|nr:hypothetical protein MN608_07872 [Microdochium nivale]
MLISAFSVGSVSNGFGRRQLLFFLAFFICTRMVSAGRPTTQFLRVFPAWEVLIRPLLQGNCSEAYARYLNPAETNNQATYLLIECLLQEFPEYRKAEMATSALVLGLTPFIIQQMGPRVADVGTLALRRPLLAMLIAGSCPIVGAEMAGTFNDPVKHLSVRVVRSMRPDLKWLNLQKPGPTVINLIAAVEYLLAIAAFINLQVLAWQLASWTVCAWAPHNAYHPYLWANLVLLIHAVHIGSLLLRVRVEKTGDVGGRRADSEQSSGVGIMPMDSNGTVPVALRSLRVLSSASMGDSHTSQGHNTQRTGGRQTSHANAGSSSDEVASTSTWCTAWLRPFGNSASGSTPRSAPRQPSLPLRFLDSITGFFSHERTPMAYAPPVRLRRRRHGRLYGLLGYLYVFLGYLVSVSAAAHVLYGTMVLSSSIFISLADAVGIIWRFSANTMICRVLLGYEITAMRENVSGIEEHNDDE